MKQAGTLKKNHEFRRLYQRGASAAGGSMVVYCRRNRLGRNRLGLTASVKIGGAVVRNRALDMLRKEARETELDPETWEPAAPPDLGEFQTLVSLICGMPEDYRRVLELRFVAEWSLEEIAQELGLTEGAVKSRVFRGRKLLADRLRKEG